MLETQSFLCFYPLKKGKELFLTMKDVPLAICFTIIGFLCFHPLKKAEVGNTNFCFALP
jgi:hypothetical protein